LLINLEEELVSIGETFINEGQTIFRRKITWSVHTDVVPLIGLKKKGDFLFILVIIKKVYVYVFNTLLWSTVAGPGFDLRGAWSLS